MPSVLFKQFKTFLHIHENMGTFLCSWVITSSYVVCQRDYLALAVQLHLYIALHWDLIQKCQNQQYKITVKTRGHSQRLHTSNSSKFRRHHILPLIKHSEYQLPSLRIHIWKNRATKVLFHKLFTWFLIKLNQNLIIFFLYNGKQLCKVFWPSVRYFSSYRVHRPTHTHTHIYTHTSNQDDYIAWAGCS
jgi:hypothetical protein